VLQYGCLVVNAPTANTVAAAEHGIALMCTLSRNVSQADASMKAGKWERTKYVGVSLVDKVLCIMGFGKVRGGEAAGAGHWTTAATNSSSSSSSGQWRSCGQWRGTCLLARSIAGPPARWLGRQGGDVTTTKRSCSE
jgi:hypothetical protein